MRLKAIVFLIAATMPLQLTEALEIVGPTKIEVREFATLTVKGATAAELPQSRLIYWPRKGCQVIPAVTWGGEPFILFTARQPGEYLLAVVIHSQDGDAYAELTITVGNPDPPPPPPDVNPYEPPSATWRSRVEPVASVRMSRADANNLAKMYHGLSNQIDPSWKTSDLRAEMIRRGKLLNLQGRYEGLAALVDAAFSRGWGLSERPVAEIEARDGLLAMAWAVWEAGAP
jgi:hypothetical protein